MSALNIYAPTQHVINERAHVLNVKNIAKEYSKIKVHDKAYVRKLRPLVLFGPTGIVKFLNLYQVQEKGP